MKCETAVLQNPDELEAFVALLVGEGVRSYLEIGSKHGGSLWRIANALPKGSLIVSVDLPHGDGSIKESDISLHHCIMELRARGYDAHWFNGDSTDPKVVRSVKRHAPFDACFIDACHDFVHVTSDWQNYGFMARIVAFHDISWWRPDDWEHERMDVPVFWNKLKMGFNHREICLEERNNGIGVLWQFGGKDERSKSNADDHRAVS